MACGAVITDTRISAMHNVMNHLIIYLFIDQSIHHLVPKWRRAPSVRRPTRIRVQPRPPNMKPLSVTFLGTCSGGGPLLSRACSSTMLNIDHAQWCQYTTPRTHASPDVASTVLDCAEGTQIQLRQAKFKPEHISKVFITHMHSPSPLFPSAPLLPTYLPRHNSRPRNGSHSPHEDRDEQGRTYFHSQPLPP